MKNQKTNTTFLSILLILLLLVLSGCMKSFSSARCTRVEDRAYFLNPPEKMNLMTTVENMYYCDNDERARTRIGENLSDAPESIRELAYDLYRNVPPDPKRLQEVDKSELNAVYRTTRGNAKYTTLLLETYKRRNYAWARALAEAGADVTALDNEVALYAIKSIWHPKSKYLHQFRDYSVSIPFLELFLEFGGGVNAREAGGFNSPIIQSTVPNIYAMFYLLENGADPWLKSKPIMPILRDPLFGRLQLGQLSHQVNEVFYRVIKAGYFVKPPTEDLFLEMMDGYLESLEYYHDTTGPKNRRRLWTLQRVVEALIEATGYEPPPRMTELLEIDRVPDKEGGWVLRKDQLHQPYDAPTGVRYDGEEIW